MRILKFIIKVLLKKEIYKYKNLSYMEASLSLIEEDDIYISE